MILNFMKHFVSQNGGEVLFLWGECVLCYVSGVCVPTGGCAVYISTTISQPLCSCVAQVTVFQVNYLCLMMVSLNPCFPNNRCSNYTQTATRTCPVLILIPVQFMYFLFSKKTQINSSFWSHTLLSTFGYCLFLSLCESLSSDRL